MLLVLILLIEIRILEIRVLYPVDDGVGGLQALPLRMESDVLGERSVEVEGRGSTIGVPAGELIARARRGGSAGRMAALRHELLLNIGPAVGVIGDPAALLDTREEHHVLVAHRKSFNRIAGKGLVLVPPRDGLVAGERIRNAVRGDLVALESGLSPDNASVIGGIAHKEDMVSNAVARDHSNRLARLRHCSGPTESEGFVGPLGIPAEESLAGEALCGRLEDLLAFLHGLDAHRDGVVSATIELIGNDIARRTDYIDGEVLDVEGLDVDLGLAGVDLGHGRGVVGHVVDGHVLAFEVRVEEADVHLAVGLDLLAVLDEGNVDGLVTVEGLALLGHGLLDGLAHGAVAHALGVNLGSGGDDAGFGGDLHSDVADVGVALERLGGGGLLGCSLGLLRHGGCLGLGGGLGLVHLLRGLLRFRAVGLVLGLRLGLVDILQRGDDLGVVSLGGGVGARVVREHGHVQEREHQEHRQQD